MNPMPPPSAGPARVFGAAPAPERGGVVFDRPVILLSAPRSGSTMLFEMLARAPTLYTVGGESHWLVESVPGLHPAARGFESNRLVAADATPQAAARLRENFARALRDRHGAPPAPGAVRFLEKTPKNTLRVPFLRTVFPDARFVYLYREPQQVLASMIEAWRSGRFRTYPDLPGWSGIPWSLLLVPGWRGLAGRPLEEIVAAQWATTVSTVLDDLEALPPGEVRCVRYEELLQDPEHAIRRVCGAVGLPWEGPVERTRLSRYTLTPPAKDKWRAHEDAIARVRDRVEPVARRAEAFVAARI